MKNKQLLISLSTVAIIAPIITMVACGTNSPYPPGTVNITEKIMKDQIVYKNLNGVGNVSLKNNMKEVKFEFGDWQRTSDIVENEEIEIKVSANPEFTALGLENFKVITPENSFTNVEMDFEYMTQYMRFLFTVKEMATPVNGYTHEISITDMYESFETGELVQYHNAGSFALTEKVYAKENKDDASSPDWFLLSSDVSLKVTPSAGYKFTTDTTQVIAKEAVQNNISATQVDEQDKGDGALYRDTYFRRAWDKYAIKYDDADIPDYQESTFSRVFSNIEEKDIYDNAALFANAVKNNDDNILSWYDPEAQKNISAENSSNAMIYAEGGPSPDFSITSFRVPQLLYGNLAHEYILNEAQYGFVPRDIIYAGGLEVDNPYLQTIKAQTGYAALKSKFDSKSLSEYEGLKILTGDITLSRFDVYMTTGIALRKIDLDRIELLAEKLKTEKDYEKVILTGHSHGFDIVGFTLAYSEGKLFDNIDKVAMESNSVSPAIPSSDNDSGGYADGDFYKEINDQSKQPKFDYGLDESTFGKLDWNTTLIPSDSSLGQPQYAMHRVFTSKYGLKDKLKDILDNDKVYGPKVLANTYMSARTRDPNIGIIVKSERDWYKNNNLNFKMIEGGHSQPTPNWYIRDFFGIEN